MLATLRHLVHVLGAYARVARLTAFSFLTAALASAVLCIPDQTLEALRVLADDSRHQHAWRWLPVVSLETSALLLATLTWYSARVVIYVADPAAMQQHDARGTAARQLPRIWGVLTLLALAWACHRAGVTTGLASSPASGTLLALTIGNAALAVVFWLFVRFRGDWLRQRSADFDGELVRAHDARTPFALPRGTLVTLSLMLGMTALVFGLVFTSDGQIGAPIGTAQVMMVALAAWPPIGSLFVCTGVYARLPVTRMVMTYVVVLSVVDCNENHQVRTLRAPPPAPVELHAALREWLATRRDAASYKDSYPLFIVAAEGGGIRNAYLTAQVLGALVDACPRFGDHLFAISSVSGGSVGAGVYAALRARAPARVSGADCTLPRPDLDSTALASASSVQATAHRILARDLLAPVIASGLYLESAQRLIPWGVGRLDRARALEIGFERAYAAEHDSALPADSLGQPFAGVWRADSLRAAVPALFLNTTGVETGRRMVIASLEPPKQRYHPQTLGDVNHLLSIRLSTAMAMSARFPLVTPEALVTDSARRTHRFVDGGYIDNSAMATRSTSPRRSSTPIPRSEQSSSPVAPSNGCGQ